MKAPMTFVLLLLVTMPGLALTRPVVEESDERIVGVKVGDWVKYGDFIGTWTSDDPSVEEPPLDIIEHNNTEWVTNTVKNISGTKITFQTVTHYKNDTETTSLYNVDVSHGGGNGTFMFISADLWLGDSIYNSTEYAYTQINQTLQLVYMNALRETNYLVIRVSESRPDEVLTLVYKTEHFWDRMTGILTERIGTFVSYRENYTTVVVRSEIMIDSNLWEGVPDTSPPTAEAGPDQVAIVNRDVSFDAGGSSDNEGGWGIASYEWDFGDGEVGTSVRVTHAFNATGNYVVTLTVKDWAGYSDEDTLTVTVQEASSSPSITGVVVLVILLIVTLLFWRFKTRR